MLQPDACDSIIKAHGQAEIAAHAACRSEADSRPNTAGTTTSEPQDGHTGANAQQRQGHQQNPQQQQHGESLAAADVSRVPVQRSKRKLRASRQAGKEAGPAAESSGQICSPAWQIVLLPTPLLRRLVLSCLPHTESTDHC